MTRRFPILFLLCLGGCASGGDGGYPSLLPRATEAQGFEEPTQPAPAPVADDAALDARIVAVAAEIAKAKGSFETASAIAERRVAAARGAATGSEAWLDAQTALGDLDVARADVNEPVSSLEQMALDRASAGKPAYPRLDAALDDGRATVAAISARIAALQQRLAR